MLKLENSIRGLSFSRVAFDLTIQDRKPYFLHCSYTILAFLSYSSPPQSGSIPYSTVQRCLYFNA